jgi:hypothetical protein
MKATLKSQSTGAGDGVGNLKLLDRNAKHGQARTWSARPRHARRALLAFGCAFALCGASAAHADAVTDWNAIANQTTALPGPFKVRALAMVQIAVHDALNAIDPRYTQYSAVPGAAADAMPEAAVAAAARDVLLAVTPSSQHAAIDAAYANALAGLPGCPASTGCQAGIAAGQAAAATIVADRSIDGSQNNPHLPYTLAPGPGVYQLTADQSTPFPVFAGWANVRPFTISDSAQFHALFRAPDSDLRDLTSQTYTVDYAQVKAFGEKSVRAGSPNSSKSRIARFWYGSGGQDWATNTRRFVEGRGLDLWEHARLFALQAIGQADVFVSVFDNKYHYSFWRPMTAIRWLDDGNPDTEPDPNWTPYLITPPYPDYPCGTPMLAGAGTEILRDFFGTDDQRWTATSNFPGQPGVPADVITRTYKSFSEAADEAAMARVYSGIHFATGCTAGVDLGEKIARYAFDNLLRPL